MITEHLLHGFVVPAPVDAIARVFGDPHHVAFEIDKRRGWRSPRARRDTSPPADCGSRPVHCAAEMGWCPGRRCRTTPVAGPCRSAASPSPPNRRGRRGSIDTAGIRSSRRCRLRDRRRWSLPTVALVAVLRFELKLEIERLVTRRKRHRHRPRAAVEKREARVQLWRGRARERRDSSCNRAWAGWGGRPAFAAGHAGQQHGTKHAETPTNPLVLMAKTSMNANRRGEHTYISPECADQPPFV